MRLWLSYFLCVFLVCIIAILWYWLSHPAFQKKISIYSPLPEFLTSIKNHQVTTLALWKPKLQDVLSGTIAKPDIEAKEVLVYDLTSEKVLYEKAPTQRRPIASLTKIMTAIIAMENKRTDDKYYVTGDALVGEDSMGLTSGEILSFEDLLYGLILPSGNDAAEVFAHNYPLGRSAFVQAMNDKAKALGLTDTNYTNPSGLQGDGDQYSTAHDLLVITKYALQFPEFRKIASTYEHHILYSQQHKEFWLYNETNLLTSYPGVKGVKTGYTPEAEYCLVTYLDYGGHEYIGIILGSNNRREEMKELLDYSLKVSGIIPPNHL